MSFFSSTGYVQLCTLKGMDEVFTLNLLISFVAGVVGALLWTGILALKIYRLQFALSTVQQHLLTVRNTDAIQKRWKKRDQLEEDLQNFAANQKSPSHSERFANDPLPYG